MSDKWKKIIYGVSGVILGAVVILCIYSFAVVIPAKREAERLAVEEQRKQWEQEDKEVSSNATIVPNVTNAVEEDADSSGTGQTGEEEDGADENVDVTETPTITPSEEKEQDATIAPEPTQTEAKNTSTPTPKPTTKPTEKPKKEENKVSVTPMPISMLKAKVQMGDNVWYEFYEKGVLLVTGTGATWDFQDVNSSSGYLDKELGEDGIEYVEKGTTQSLTQKIIISEGITELGNFSVSFFRKVNSITLPKSLQSIGENTFSYLGNLADSVEWIGLDLKNMEVATTAFYHASGLEGIENIEKYQAEPTPTPIVTPTPTPTPDPANPKLLYTQQLGDNIYYEFWDSDIIYIKGTGATWKMNYATIDFDVSVKKVIVEEGVTHLRECSLFVDFEEVILPKSLKETDLGVGFVYPGNKVTAYKDGKKMTITAEQKTDIGRFLEANFGIPTEVISFE